MEWVSKGRLVFKMIIMRISVSLLILSILVVVEADDDQYAHHLSPHPPHTKISFSFASNSSEDYLSFENYIPKTIKVGSKIFHNVKQNVLRLASNLKDIVGLGKGSSSEIQPEKNDSEIVGVTYGFHLLKGVNNHVMEDYVVAETSKIGEHVVGLFAIFDGYTSHDIPAYLQSHLLKNIITKPDFLTKPKNAVRTAYIETDTSIQEKSKENTIAFSRLAASTAVTAIIMKRRGKLNYKLVVANVGDSRAVICCKNGIAKQLSVDHDANNEMKREAVQRRDVHVSDPPMVRVSEMFPLTRAFGITYMKKYVSCEPNVVVEMIDGETKFLVLASRPLWKMMSNQEVVNSIGQKMNAHEAAAHLTQKARNMANYFDKDDISCVVVRFR